MPMGKSNLLLFLLHKRSLHLESSLETKPNRKRLPLEERHQTSRKVPLEEEKMQEKVPQHQTSRKVPLEEEKMQEKAPLLPLDTKARASLEMT